MSEFYSDPRFRSSDVLIYLELFACSRSGIHDCSMVEFWQTQILGRLLNDTHKNELNYVKR